MNVWKVIRQEWRRLWQGRLPAALIILLLPLAFTLVFGFVYYQNTVNSIPLVVCDEDQSVISRTIIQAYNDSDKFEIVAQTASLDVLTEELAGEKAVAGLYIPKDLSYAMKQGRSVNLMLAINSANNMFGNAALTAAAEINKTLSTGIAVKLLEAKNLLPAEALNTVYPVRLGIRILNNPTTGYSSFMLAGLTMNGLQIAIMLVLCPLIAREYQEHNDETGISSAVIILVKMLWTVFLAVLSFGLSLFFLHVVFAVPAKGGIAIFSIVAAFSLAVAGIMTVFASLSSDEVMSIETPLLYIMPGLLYSGLSWPDFYMNDWAMAIAKIFPLWHAGDTVRDLLLAGYAPDLVRQVWQLSAMGAISYGLGAGIFAWRRRYDVAKIKMVLCERICGKKRGR